MACCLLFIQQHRRGGGIISALWICPKINITYFQTERCVSFRSIKLQQQWVVYKIMNLIFFSPIYTFFLFYRFYAGFIWTPSLCLHGCIYSLTAFLHWCSLTHTHTHTDTVLQCVALNYQQPLAGWEWRQAEGGAGGVCRHPEGHCHTIAQLTDDHRRILITSFTGGRT